MLLRARDWKVCPDAEDVGLAANWQARTRHDAVVAPVPGIIQQVFPDYHGVAWYWSELPPLPVPSGHRAFLRFESVDYAARVWVNSCEIGSHEGDGVAFELDATDYLSPERANLLAVRVVNPTHKPIDGLVLREVPHSNKVSPGEFKPGWSYNFGGITGEVVLHVEPAARLRDIAVRPKLTTGVITVDVTVDVTVPGAARGDCRLAVSVLVSEDRSGLLVAHARRLVEAVCPPREPPVAHLELEVPLSEVRPWDIDDPFLYCVRVRLEPAEANAGGDSPASDEKTVRAGFRELRVRDGWFELNGRRLYLRCAHTGNHYPVGQVVPPDKALVRQDLVYAKAAGFNAVRFIAGVAREDQLSFCDELGLMVYEETRASWLLADSPRMSEHFDRSFDEMIKRDRNHPCVVIWGLLNETYDGPVFRHAVGYLARLRQLDDTRLVLLSSGRWDGDLAIGSVCNPGETTWRHEWGSERAGAPRVEVGWADDRDRGAYVPGAGDVHLYPSLPESAGAKHLVRTMGAGTNPVFLSEYGVGSLFDAVTALGHASSHLASARLGDGPLQEPPDVTYIRSMAEHFFSDWERFGMDRLYCFPEDAFLDSQLNQSLHRAATFDLIRANANIAGYNLTGMLDHALTGEGPWTVWRRWKPLAMETTSEGWSPLRWCLSVAPSVAFAGGEIDLDVALANEDVLSPGKYKARVAIVGPGGWRWQRSADVVVARGRGQLALPVLAQRVTLDGPPGTYRCAASLGTAGAAAGGRAAVEVVRHPTPLTPHRRAAAVGFPQPALGWLTSHGLEVADGLDAPMGADVLLLGHLAGLTDRDWHGITAAVEAGLPAVVLCPWELIGGGGTPAVLPFAGRISCSRFHDWLYHKECFTTHAGIVDGLPGPGLMTWQHYAPVLPRHMLHGHAEDVAAFAVAVGFPCPGGYASGLVAAGFRHGSGRVVVSTFDLLAHLGSLAVADHLTVNLLRYALQAGLKGGSLPR